MTDLVFILLGYENTVQYVAVAYEFYLKQSTAFVLTCQNLIPIHYKLSDYRLFHAFLITQSIEFFLLFQIRETCFIAHIPYEMLSKQINDSCQWFGKVDLKVKTAISSGMSLKHVNPLHRTYMCVECAQLV